MNLEAAKQEYTGTDKADSEGSKIVTTEAGDERVKPKLRVGTDAMWHRRDDMEVCSIGWYSH